MDVRWSKSRRVEATDPDEKKRKRNRTGPILLLTLAVAAGSGVAAMLGIGPFGSLQALAHQIVYREQPASIQAGAIFPSVPPVHKIVNVYDPPRPAPAPKPAPQPENSPSPSSHPSPTPTDDGGGGNDN
jgi:hypothetical protein